MTDARSQGNYWHPSWILRGFWRDETAASAVFFAITMASTIGFVGLGVESGLWFAEKRQYQTAADAGAIAGALQMSTQLTGGSAASLDISQTGASWKEAVRNGASTFVLNTSVQQLTKNGKQVAHVEVSEAKSPILAALALTGVTIKTSAEASVETLGRPCLNGLGTTGTVISIQGSASLNAPNCVLASNSTASGTGTGNGNNQASVTIQGGNNTTVHVAQIYSTGSVVMSGNPSVEAPLSGMNSTSAASNPFNSVTAPTTPTVPTAPSITSVSSPNGSNCQNISGTTLPSSTNAICALPAGKNPAPGNVTLTAGTWSTAAGTVNIKGALTIPSGVTLSVPSGSTLNVFGDLTVPGSLTVSGTLYVDGNVSSSGSLTLNSGLTVNASGTAHNVSITGGTTSITGAVKLAKGGFTVSSGTASVTGNVSLGNGNFSVSGGTVTVTGNVNLTNGSFSASGGTTTVTGQTNLGSGNLSFTGGTTTLNGNVGLTSGSFSITGNGTTVYIKGTDTIVGSFSIGSGGKLYTLSGQSSTIALGGSTGSFSFNSNSTVNITAPSSGNFAGIALYQDPASSNTSSIGGGSFTMLGAAYAKNATVNFGGNASTVCALIIAKAVNFSGNSNLDASGCSNYGVSVPTFYKVSLSD